MLGIGTNRWAPHLDARQSTLDTLSLARCAKRNAGWVVAAVLCVCGVVVVVVEAWECMRGGRSKKSCAQDIFFCVCLSGRKKCPACRTPVNSWWVPKSGWGSKPNAKSSGKTHHKSHSFVQLKDNVANLKKAHETKSKSQGCKKRHYDSSNSSNSE